MKIMILHAGLVAFVVYHLRPLMMYSSPWRTTELLMFVASDEATSGSVIAKAERISPANNGFSQRSFCASVPYLRIVSMLPVSGAEQLKTSGANRLRPIISQSGAYSTLVSPSACSFAGRKRLHR